jgi:hypothetical protein
MSARSNVFYAGKSLQYKKPRRHRRGKEIQLYVFFNLGSRRERVGTPHTGNFIPEKETRYPLFRRLGARAGLEKDRKFAPTGIRSPICPSRSNS